MIKTELKSKNKKKIYIGDIVQEDYYVSRFKDEPLYTRDENGKLVWRELKGYDPFTDPIKKGKWITEKQEAIFEIKSLRQIYDYLKEQEDKFDDEEEKRVWMNGGSLNVIGHNDKT